MTVIKIDGNIFKAQFLLSTVNQCVPRGWGSDCIGIWHLYYCESLPVTLLHDKTGETAGWLLGYPISEQGGIVQEHQTKNRNRRGDSILEELEDYISRLAGRFAAICITDEGGRVYTDPGGQRSVVFNQTERLVASSVCLATSCPEWDTEAIAAVSQSSLDGYFPFGLTPEKNVKRLLPNHYLDLATFETKRFWPLGDCRFGSCKNARKMVEYIADKLEKNIDAVARNYKIQISLTAGRDSRMILAAARKRLPEVEFFTTALPDEIAALDCRVAGALAFKYNLRHRVLEWEDSSKAELDNWQKRVGYSVGGRNWKSARTLFQLDPSRVVLHGLCAEVGRAHSWKKSDFECKQITKNELINQIKVPLYSPFLVEAKKWLEKVPLSNRLDILDLAHIEQKLGCWGGPSQDGHFGINIAPFSDREIFNSMMKLPYRYRFEQRLAKDFLKYKCPGLLSFPFNREPTFIEQVKSHGHQLARENPKLASILKTLIRGRNKKKG